MRFQLTVIAEESKVEGMFTHLKSDYLPHLNAQFQLRLGEKQIYGKVHDIVHVLDIVSAADTAIVYVSVSMDDYRWLEVNLPVCWGNFDHC